MTDHSVGLSIYLSIWEYIFMLWFCWVLWYACKFLVSTFFVSTQNDNNSCPEWNLFIRLNDHWFHWSVCIFGTWCLCIKHFHIFQCYWSFHANLFSLCRLWLKNTLKMLLQRGNTSPTRPTVDSGWRPVILKKRMLVAEQSFTQQLKWSPNRQHSTLTLTKLDGLLEMLNPINRPVV